MLCSCEEAKAPETLEILEEKPFTTYQIYWNKTDDVYYLKTDGHADTVSDFFHIGLMKYV